MLSIIQETKPVISTEDKPNYKVEKFKKPPKKSLQKEDGNLKYRKKVVYGKDGQKHMLNLAFRKKAGPKGGKTVVTSKWDKK